MGVVQVRYSDVFIYLNFNALGACRTMNIFGGTKILCIFFRSH